MDFDFKNVKRYRNKKGLNKKQWRELLNIYGGRVFAHRTGLVPWPDEVKK